MNNQPQSPQPQSRSRRLLLWLLVVVLVALGVVWFYFNPVSFKKGGSATNANTNATNANTDVGLPTRITYQGQDGKSGLDLLKEKHAVIESNGFVQAINGRANSKNAYWFFYVNGQSSDVGAKDYVTKSGDTLEWRFEENRP